MSKILANQIANYGDNSPIEIKEGLNIPIGKPLQAAGVSGGDGQVLTSTGTTVEWTTPFDGDYDTLTNKPIIPAAQVRSDWNAIGTVAEIQNKPLIPPLPSVTVAAAGSASLEYNSTSGLFTYTPPDLSGYLTSYTETDPVFAASDAAAVTAAKISNWDAAHGWGNHASAGYLTSYTETQTLDNVLSLGATTTRDITTTGKLYYSNNFATTGDLPNATTYHGMFAHVHAEGHGYFAHAGAWTQLLDTGSSISELADVNLAVAPQSGQVLAYDGSNWVATAAGGGGGGIALTDLSVSTASAGTAALTYNNVSGVFTYTPPDLSSYAQTANLSIANWDAAYGWGNHASAGYLSSYTETDTLDSVTGRGSSTTNNVSFGNIDSPQGTIKAGNQIGGVFTGSTITADGRLTIINRIAGGNLIYAGYFFNSIQNTFVVDSNANLTLSGSLTAGGEIKTERFGTPVALGADSSNAAIRIGTSVSPPFRVDYSGNIVASGSLTAGGLTYPTSNGNSGDVLTSNGSGSVTWAAPTGGGANVTISDTIPAGTPTAGDLWWESDTGRLKVYYTDTDSSQWVDASPPLTQDRIASSSAPSSASDTGTPGDIRYDSGYVYICISNNTWKRAALATW